MGEMTVREKVLDMVKDIDKEGFWSNSQNPGRKARFQALTSETQDTLNKKWYVVENGVVDKERKGSDPTFTTCTGFLSQFATAVQRSGWQARKPFRPFKQNVDLVGYGWVDKTKYQSWQLGSVDGLKPEPGDFFFAQEPPKPPNKFFGLHVGIIVAVNEEGNQWDTVAGGRGGRARGADGVSRDGVLKPDWFTYALGWLKVNEFFQR